MLRDFTVLILFRNVNNTQVCAHYAYGWSFSLKKYEGCCHFEILQLREWFLLNFLVPFLSKDWNLTDRNGEQFIEQPGWREQLSLRIVSLNLVCRHVVYYIYLDIYEENQDEQDLVCFAQLASPFLVPSHPWLSFLHLFFICWQDAASAASCAFLLPR